MQMAEVQNPKTSDEILNELFDSLNLPVSPKPVRDKQKNLESKESSQSDNSKDGYDDSSENSNLSSHSCTDQEIDKLLEEITDLSDKNNTIDKTPNKFNIIKDKKKKRKKLKKSGSSKSKKKKKKLKEKEDKVLNLKKQRRISDESTHSLDKSSTHDHDNRKHKKKRSKERSRSRSVSSSRYSKKIKRYSRSSSNSRYSGRVEDRHSRHKHSCSPSRSSQKSENRLKSRHSRHSSSSGSGSPLPRRYHKEKRSKSRSRSPLKKESKDPLDVWRNAKLASLKKDSSEINCKFDVNEKEDENDSVPIEHIPLPISSTVNVEMANPSVIPLPSEESAKLQSKDIDLTAIPIPSCEENSSACVKASEGVTVESSQKSETALKPQEKVKEEGKLKVIVIKSLKDSVVYQQAEEEAQKKAKTEDCHFELSQTNLVKTDEKVADGVRDEVGNEVSSEQVINKEAEPSSIIENESNSSNVQKERKEKSSLDEEVFEEGEIRNENEDDSGKVLEPSEKRRDKKDKKIKNKDSGSSKDHKKSKRRSSRSRSRDKSKKREKKGRSRSDARRKSRSSSRSKRKSRSRSRSVHESRSSISKPSKGHSRHHRKSNRLKSRSSSRSRSRSKSKRRESDSKSHKKSTHSRSESKYKTSWRNRRSASRDFKEKSPDCVDSLRDKATRKKLLEVARRNAVYLMQNNLPPVIEKVTAKTTGKSVEELTNFCQQLVAKDYSDAEFSDPSLSSDEQDSQFETPFGGTRHPFALKDSKPILMNIRNAPMLPTKTNAERLADTSKLREQFPVSSGSQHRTVAESGWVPVKKDVVKDKEEEVTVFPDAGENLEVDISQLVSTRLSAMRRLQDNPSDQDARKALDSAQKEMQDWALSKKKPGQFTGSTGARILSQEELSSGHQAWARKEQFKEANPVSSHFGLKMLQKMGWNPGEGLGKNKEGQLEPLLLDVKMDKKGLTAQEEMTPRRTPIPLAKNLAGKHPVSALVEICSKKKWSPPEFEIVYDCGPDHKKNFLMKVHVNNQIYKPAIAACTKKIAKANAAAACLQALGLIPRDTPPKPQGTLHTIPQPQSQESAPNTALPPLPQPIQGAPHALNLVQAGLVGSSQVASAESLGCRVNATSSTLLVQQLRAPLDIPTPQDSSALSVPLPPSAAAPPPPLPSQSSGNGNCGPTPLFPVVNSDMTAASPVIPSDRVAESSLCASNLYTKESKFFGAPFQQPPCK